MRIYRSDLFKRAIGHLYIFFQYFIFHSALERSVGRIVHSRFNECLLWNVRSSLSLRAWSSIIFTELHICSKPIHLTSFNWSWKSTDRVWFSKKGLPPIDSHILLFRLNQHFRNNHSFSYHWKPPQTKPDVLSISYFHMLPKKNFFCRKKERETRKLRQRTSRHNHIGKRGNPKWQSKAQQCYWRDTTHKLNNRK